MARFGWFGDTEHRVFNYKPIYYDKEAEERRKMFGEVDGSLDKKAEEEGYSPGSRIQGAFRGGNYARRRGAGSRAQSIIGIITLLLIFFALFMIVKVYSLI